MRMFIRLGSIALLLQFWVPLQCHAEWTILTEQPAHSIAARGEYVFAAVKDGLLTMQQSMNNDSAQAESVMVRDPFFQSTKNVKKVFILDAAQPKVYVIANATLFVSELGHPPYTWKRVFSETEKRDEIIDVHGNGKVIAFLEKEDVSEGDATHVNTVRSGVFRSKTGDPKDAYEIGRFAATQVFVSRDGDVFTYGDVYGPYAPDVGIYESEKWRHEKPLTVHDGHLFHDRKLLFLVVPAMVLRSYDLGRDFKPITNDLVAVAGDFTDVVSSGDTVFVATSENGIYVSTDQGESFKMHSSEGNKNFPSNKVLLLYLDPVQLSLYVTTDKGIAVKRQVGHGEVRKVEKLSLFSKVVHGAEERAVF